MFTTSFGFHLLSLINLVNKHSTLLSFMTSKAADCLGDTTNITEVIISGMELGILHTFFNTIAKNLWFNSTCSRAVKDIKTVLKRYRSHPPAETHALYITANKHAKSIFQLNKNSSININCHNLSKSNSSRDFWHLANDIHQFYFFTFPSFTLARWLYSCLFFL